MANSASDVVERSEVESSLRSAAYACSDHSLFKEVKIRSNEMSALFKNIGTKEKSRWTAPRNQVLELLVQHTSAKRGSSGRTSLKIQLGDAQPLMEIDSEREPAVLQHEFLLRLKLDLGKDRSVKRELQAIDNERDEAIRADAKRRRNAGLERMRPNLDVLRRGIREMAPLFQARLWGLHDIEKLSNDLEAIRNATEKITPRGTPSGNVDVVVERILRAYDLSSINDAPHLLSATGFLVDSGTCLAVLQVRDDFRKRKGERFGSLDYQLSVGYRPHVEVIKELPNLLYEHPSYFAPIEDLLDWMAIDFYSGRHSGDAEDGAVGWLLERMEEEGESTRDRYEILAQECSHWLRERLEECAKCWKEVVRPVLVAGKV